MKKNNAVDEFNLKYPKQVMSLQGSEFPYRYHRNGDITLFLLPGGMGLSDTCFSIFDAFAKDFSVVTFDYPHGYQSNKLLLAAIADLIQKQHMNNVYLVGQSYGGFLAQLMAKYYPELVQGIVLSNTGTLAYEMAYDGIQNLSRMLEKSARWRDKYDNLLPLFLLKPLLKLSIQKKCKDCTKEEAAHIVSIFTSVFDQITHQHLYHMDNLLADLKNEWGFVPNDFSHLDGNVLLLLSEDDSTFHPEVRKALIRVMPHPIINDRITGGHLALMLHPETYINTIKSFIEK